jgi:hypothetical protein
MMHTSQQNLQMQSARKPGDIPKRFGIISALFNMLLISNLLTVMALQINDAE